MTCRPAILLLLTMTAGCAGVVRASSTDVYIVRSVDAERAAACETCEVRRLRFFDGKERAVLVEVEPVMQIAKSDVRLLVATELRTMTEPHLGYWEIRAILTDATRASAIEVTDRHRGVPILTDTAKKWFAISDTELLHEALVVARVASRSEAIEVSVAIGAPTEWHELDEREWLRDKEKFQQMLEDEPPPAAP